MNRRLTAILLFLATCCTPLLAGTLTVEVTVAQLDDGSANGAIGSFARYYWSRDWLESDPLEFGVTHVVQGGDYWSGTVPYDDWSNFIRITNPQPSHCYYAHLTVQVFKSSSLFTSNTASAGPACVPNYCYLTVSKIVAGQQRWPDTPPSGRYPCGTVIVLTAAPEPGWTFEGWTGAIVDSNPYVQVVVNRDMEIFATFRIYFDDTPDDPPTDSGNPTGGGHNYATEPLVLDLDGDGIITTDVAIDPVRFDMNADGILDLTGWTAPGADDALLYFDLNHNATIDGAAELFGDATRLPDGTRARTGFEALAAYDTETRGGNGDGVIARGDRVWGVLRLWIDADHDGRETPHESYTLAALGVVELALTYREATVEEGFGRDASGNWHAFQGAFRRRLNIPGGPTIVVDRLMTDIYFRTRLSK